MNDYLRVIKLGFGKGVPGEQACWMTALQSHIGGNWTDKCDCVDPLINNLCITINDLYQNNDAARTEDVLAFGLFRPLGTRGSGGNTLTRLVRTVEICEQWMEMLKGLHGSTLNQVYPEVTKAILQRVTSRFEGMSHPTSHTLSPSIKSLSINLSISILVQVFADLTDAYAHIFTTGINIDFESKKREFLLKYVYPALAELIEMGPHEMKEPECPVNGIAQFHELCGVSNPVF